MQTEILQGSEIPKKLRRGAKGCGLTPREIQVVSLVASGEGVKSIARTLAIAPRTVDFHFEHIRRKTKGATMAAAVFNLIFF